MITEKLLTAIFSFLGALMWILEVSFCCCVNWAHFAPNVYDVPFSSCCFFLAKPSFISCLCSFLLFTFGRIFFIDPNPLASLWILYHTTNKQTTTWRPKILKKKINFRLIMTKYWLNFRKCKQLPTTADRPNERKLSHKEKIVTVTRYSNHLSPRICMHWWVTVLTLFLLRVSKSTYRFYFV